MFAVPFFTGLALDHGVLLIVSCHGQLYRATMVRVVSRELEKVLVEQNHCHGLNIASKTWVLNQQSTACLIQI